MTTRTRRATTRTLDVRLDQVAYAGYQLMAASTGIALMESQLELMRRNIQALKGKAKEKKKERRDKGPVASPSKSSSSEQIKGLPNNKKGKKPVYDNDVLTFEQMKHLSEAIAQLDGQKLERVIKIVHEGVPEIKDVIFFPPSLITAFMVCRTNRARGKSSSRLTCSRPRFLRSCTTLFCVRRVRQRQNGSGRQKVRALVG